MHEVPRPKRTGTSSYDSFEDTYGKPTPIDLPPLKPGANVELAPQGVLDKEKVQAVIKCTWCSRLRCVYVKAKLSAITQGAAPQCNLKHMLDDPIDANKGTYTCGADLDIEGFGALSGVCRPYVRLKLDCSQHMELQLYSSKILPRAEAERICGYCGEEGSRREAEDETSEVLPVCQPCYEQHRKARPSGRHAPRFDRSGQRVQRAALARSREAQVQAAQDRASLPRQSGTIASLTSDTTGNADSRGRAAQPPADEQASSDGEFDFNTARAPKRPRVVLDAEDETSGGESDEMGEDDEDTVDDGSAVPVRVEHECGYVAAAWSGITCICISRFVLSHPSSCLPFVTDT